MKKYSPTKSNKGGRNLFCSHYGSCLDIAIKEAWDSWNCTRCDYKNRVGDQSAMIPASYEDITYYEFGGGFTSTDLDGLANL